MESIVKKGTKISPEIHFNAKEGVIELAGRSLPEQAYDLYKPLIKWVDDYKVNAKDVTIVNLRLEYINSSSNKYLLQILKKVDEIGLSKKVIINWYYDEDDDDLLDTAKEYNDVLDSEINIIAVPDEEM